MLKSAAGAIVRLKDVVRVRMESLAITVTLMLPAGVLCDVEMLSILCPLSGSRSRLNTAVTPAGSALVVKFTEPISAAGLIVTAKLAPCPATIV